MSTRFFLTAGSTSRLMALRRARPSLVRLLGTTPRFIRVQSALAMQVPRGVARQLSTTQAAADTSDVYRTDSGLFVDRSLPANFKKVLIANRGEIACRVIRTCKELGVRTVAVYSDADAKSMHVQLADEAYRIGEAAAAKSYLSFEAILDVAKRSGAQAIHPGYGFLSENAKFADACEKEGIVFIGPPGSAINAMGSKSASKILMTNAKVPVVPGYHGDAQDTETLRKEAARCGYPIMLKAVLGGGGKGMRIVRGPEEFDEMLDACKREALASFKDDRVLLERYITRPRHIEFQIFADKHGNVVHLYERDCSVQRRHQKVLEEAPAPGMTPELREKMGTSACDAARAVGYVGAGTVEFIFDAETDEYFFMEMNTRLQVEHPVTEMITGRDLVQWQLHVAAGHKLPVSQETIVATARGHSLEARIYAENPTNNFLPATGKLVHLRPPVAGPNVRVETGVREGDEVSIFYDPMIAKLVVWAPDREAALKRMMIALDDYQIVGAPTNVAFLQKAVANPAFAKGMVETGFIAEHMDQLMPKQTPTPAPHVFALGAFSLLEQEKAQQAAQLAASADFSSPFASTSGFRLNGTNPRRVSLMKTNPLSSVEAENVKVATNATVVTNADGSYTFSFEDGESLRVAGRVEGRDVTAVVGERAYRATVVPDGVDVHVFVDGEKTQLTRPEVTYGVDADKLGSGSVAPMAGKVVKVLVESKQHVKKGSPLVIMEAMKMEHVIRAPKDGEVEAVLFAAGDFVDGGKIVVTFVKPKDEK